MQHPKSAQPATGPAGAAAFGRTGHELMARAVALARRGLWSTDPNPRVGCVIAREGAVLAEGWHERAGGPHAEVVALQRAGESARGATAYVTLEPCSHHGRTPPCTDRLLASGVAHVVAAMADPDPRVAGSGIRVLREAGVEVDVGLLAGEAAALNPGFVSRMTRGRPWVRLKLAASLDGRTAMASGESRWISGEHARADVHRWRARSSAILTGVDSVIADDPALTARVPGAWRQPRPVVVDSRLRTPAASRVLAGGALVVAIEEDDARRSALEGAGAEVLALPAEADRVSLPALLRELGRREVNELLVECGPRLAGALLDAGLVDEMLLYLAPTLLGAEGRPLAHLPGVSRLAERVELDIEDVRRVGADLRIIARPRHGPAGAGD